MEKVPSQPRVASPRDEVSDGAHQTELAETASDNTDNLGNRAARGSAWTMIALLIGRALSFASNLVLARMLSPADFGLVSFAMLLVNAFGVVQDLGTQAAVIYSGRDPQRTAATALTLNVVVAALLFVGMETGAPLLAAFGGSADVTPVARALAIGLVVTALGQVQDALFVRRLAFGKKVIADVLPLFASATVSIIAALAGWGAWSLVAGYLVKALANTGLLWGLSPNRLWPGFDRTVAAELIGYGKHVSATGIIAFGGLNTDYLVVQRFLGMEALGIYTMAFVIGSLPSTILARGIGRPLFAAYSRARSDASALAALFENGLLVVSALAFPVGIMVIVGAPLIPTLVGDKWAAAVLPLQILVIWSVAACIRAPFPSLLKAVGRPDLEWKISVAGTVALPTFIAGAVWFGIAGVAVTHVLGAAAELALLMAVVSKVGGPPIGRQLSVLWPQFAGAAAVALSVAAFFLGTRQRMPADGLAAGALGLVSLTLYTLVVLVLSPRLRELVRKVFHAGYMRMVRPRIAFAASRELQNDAISR